MSALSDLLNSQPVTARQAADMAAEKGIDLRYGTLAGYWAGNHGRPTRESLAKLAKVVPQLSESKLQEAAWGTTAPLGPYEPTKESVHLTGPQRRALDRLIKSIVEERGEFHAVPVDPTSQSDASAEAPETEEAQLYIVIRCELSEPDKLFQGASIEAVDDNDARDQLHRSLELAGLSIDPRSDHQITITHHGELTTLIAVVRENASAAHEEHVIGRLHRRAHQLATDSVSEQLKNRGGRPLSDIEGSQDPRVDRRPEGDSGEDLSGGEVV
ncbi:hypothetical protein H7J86_24130 [Mycobacterium hackensackense]|uniref:hypothetical protein n=1 Tax=Mycobacterium hackensackense TaxID=228909 RepID=UPI002265950A|nr:hypothetical protein [Mycobacterium hackensackense]MCV7255255.1 hypothetical protein [Mycobacterium hackensackense]